MKRDAKPANCPKCNEPLGGATVVCPHCGATLVEDDSKSRRRRQRRRDATAARPSRLHVWRTVLLVLLAIVVFVGAMAGAAYSGIYLGERDRQTNRVAVIEEHYQAGIIALNEGRLERAAAEFAYVLELDPGHRLAEQGLIEARSRVEVQPTPTLEAAYSLAEQLLAQAQTAYESEDWVAAARTLTQLRSLDPDHSRELVEQMLFNSLYQAGQAYLEEDLLEIGISYLDQAIALRPLNPDLATQRNLTARYLDALNYWGVDWELCIERFEALYASAPNFRDVPQRLYRAYIEYGDDFAERGEHCPAEIQYTRALRLFAGATVEEARASSAQICLIATPVPASGTAPHLTPQPIEGFTMGRLAYPVYNSTSGGLDLYALYADGRIIRVSSGADQPSWEWSTGRLTYRDRASGAIRMMLPEEGVPLQLLPPGRYAWPTLSPDNQRLAYATLGEDGTWHIEIANTDGSGEPRRLASGWAPAWGRGGLLAYTGCDAQGNCGITLDNPDDDQPGGRLTGSRNDTAVSWAPGGNLMAYMSNVTGNWDLFLLSPDGGVEQLTTETSDEGLPAWSPDGSKIAFVSNRDGSWAIYVMELSTRQVQRVLDLGATLPGWEEQRLSWSP